MNAGRKADYNPQKPNIGLGVQDVEITTSILFPIVIHKDKFIEESISTIKIKLPKRLKSIFETMK